MNVEFKNNKVYLLLLGSGSKHTFFQLDMVLIQKK